MSKIVTFNPHAREKLADGVNILGNAVGVTLGPKGRNVAIDTYGTPSITKDGVTVAKYITLTDPIENLGAQIIKQAAAKTATVAGDGTTTATVIAQSLVNNAIEILKDPTLSPIDIKRGFEQLLSIVLGELTLNSIPVEDSRIRDIATISANNDPFIGELIASAFKEVGRDGILTVEDSKTNETYVKVVDGVSIDRGYMSPYFINDAAKMQTVFENPYVFVTDHKIRSTQDIVPVVELALKQSRPLIIIADELEQQALALLVLNRIRQNIPVVAVRAPAFGERRLETLKDLAVLTGAELVTEAKGMRLESTRLEHLGTCKKVIVSQDETIFVDPAGDKTVIENRALEVRAALENSRNEYEKEKLTERLARLVAKIAVLYIGAATEAEVKEKKDRVDDAIRATRSAIVKGYVNGGGTTLYEISQRLDGVNAPILNAFKVALQAPINLILSNAGLDPETILPSITATNGYDAMSNTFTNLEKAGVIDPTLVVEQALINGVSAANMIILSEVTLHDTVPKYSPPSPDEYEG